jgi:hypothetical protein
MIKNVKPYSLVGIYNLLPPSVAYPEDIKVKQYNYRPAQTLRSPGV